MNNEAATSELRSDDRAASRTANAATPSSDGDSRSMRETSEAPSYLAGWLRVYDSVRSKGVQALAAFAARLTAEFPAPAFATSKSPAAPEQTSPISASLGFVTRWRLMRRQRGLLRSVFPNSPAKPASWVALSARRSPIENARPLRGRLRALMQGLPGVSEPDRVARAMCDAGPILLFETCRQSTLWKDADQLWEETVFIVDYEFLAFVLASTPIATLRSMWKRRAELRAIVREGRTWRNAVGAWTLELAYADLLTDVPRARGFLLISNCFATEVLRVFLLNSPRCTAVVEVLHGVPTVEFDEYYRALLHSDALKAKHLFVAQTPALPLYGLLSEPGVVEPDLAINTAFNKYLLTKIDRRTSIALQFELECERALGIDFANPPLVVTWTGGISHAREYFSSPMFAVEAALMRHALEVLKATGRPYAVLYTPHPLHAWSTVSSVPFFAENGGIVLHSDSIFSWIVADLCVGLYSSGLFEAKFTGAQPFTPMLVSDEIYSPSLLGQLQHPAENERTLAALSRFLLGAADSPRYDMRVRIRERATRLFPECRPDAEAIPSASAH